MDIVHTPKMFLVFIVINVFSVGINLCTGVMGNAPVTIKEIFTERLVFNYREGLYFKYVQRLSICHGWFKFQHSFMERKRVRGLPEMTQAFQMGEKTYV